MRKVELKKKKDNYREKTMWEIVGIQVMIISIGNKLFPAQNVDFFVVGKNDSL